MSTNSQGASVRSALPQPWEESDSFSDRLYDWMEHAPWLAISLVAHVTFFLLLAVIPWSLFDREQLKVVQVTPEIANEAIVEEPPPEPEPELLPVESPEEPFLHENDPMLSSESEVDDFAADLSDSDEFSPVDFEVPGSEGLLGIAGGGGRRLGGRFNGGGGGGGGRLPLAEIDLGLSWLAAHQDEDGKWDSDEFMKHDPASEECTGPGHGEHDVGLTGLALLAFLGNGNTTLEGKYRDQVVRGIRWLTRQQDFENGLIGEKIGTTYLYDHGIATLALCEAYYFSNSPFLRGYAKKAVSYVTQARNAYGVWRYESPPNGDSDTSVSGWMIFALKSAHEAGLEIDSQAFPDMLTWLDEVTDPANGRAGYQNVGSPSARIPGLNDSYPTSETEAMTAVALLCRLFLGQDPAEEAVLKQHADLLLRKLPEWSEDGTTNDLYYWYYGTYAMYQMGGNHWTAWNKSMKRAMLDSQGKSGSARGSWDPNGPWGAVGGRVYSTATMVLCLEVYFRYSRVLGAR